MHNETLISKAFKDIQDHFIAFQGFKTPQNLLYIRENKAAGELSRVQSCSRAHSLKLTRTRWSKFHSRVAKPLPHLPVLNVLTQGMILQTYRCLSSGRTKCGVGWGGVDELSDRCFATCERIRCPELFRGDLCFSDPRGFEL